MKPSRRSMIVSGLIATTAGAYWYARRESPNLPKVLRTPDSQFVNLKDYPFKPNYITIPDPLLGDMRLHYLDEGPKDGPLLLLMHGEPSWSYLYRKMIPALVKQGFRCIAPDLIGFGKSDKPARKADYSYENHVRWMSAFLTQMNLQAVTLFCQDWGGLIGLRLVAAFPDRFARVVISNTALPEGKEGELDGAFKGWRFFATYTPVLPVGRILNQGTVRGISDAERSAYDAPYPGNQYKAGAIIFPSLVPLSPDAPSAKENSEAWKVLERFDRPVLTVFGDSDPVTLGWEKRFQKRVPGTKGQAHRIIKQAGHFIQEDAPDELVTAITDFCAANKM
jgi:haloalkane dehalogenase